MSAISLSSDPSRSAFPSWSTSVAVWKKRARASCAGSPRCQGPSPCVFPRPVGPWKTRSSARPTKSSGEHVVAAPAVGEAHVRPVEALDRLGTRNPPAATASPASDCPCDSSSRASIPEHAESWPGVAVSRNHDIVSLDMNSDLARGELPALRLRDSRQPAAPLPESSPKVTRSARQVDRLVVLHEARRPARGRHSRRRLERRGDPRRPSPSSDLLTSLTAACAQGR